MDNDYDKDYPDFDRSTLTERQRKILADFAERRSIMDAYLKAYLEGRDVRGRGFRICTCPGCAYPTGEEPGSYLICPVCGWEHDMQDDDDADVVWGGPNFDLSLTEYRIKFGEVLQEMAEKMGGKINTNPKEIISILKHRDRKIVSRIISPPDITDIRSVTFNIKHSTGQIFLWRLIEINNAEDPGH